MKKSTLFRIAMTLTAMLFVSGVFAQITLTIKNSDGTPANAAVVYTLSSYNGTSTTVVTATALGVASLGTPAAGNHTYLIRNAANDRFANYSINYDGAAAISKTITLGAVSTTFNPAIANYVAMRTGDTITINKAMPFWVYPSVAYNPSFTNPTNTGSYTLVANNIVTAAVTSTFSWNLGGGTGTYYNAAGGVIGAAPYKNYVEVAWATTGSKVISVTETPAASACTGDPVIQLAEVIDVPDVDIANTTTTDLGLDRVIVSNCDGDPTLTLAITFTINNAAEKYPYHFNVPFKVFNVTKLTALGEIPHTTAGGSEVVNTLSADVSDITSNTLPNFVSGSEDATTVPSNANPIIVTSGTDLVASQAYNVQNNKITVYEFTYNNVNAKFSRKSDYLAMRNGNYAATDYERFSYYPTTANDFRYYIIALPTPVTGPIYHISNSFAF